MVNWRSSWTRSRCSSAATSSSTRRRRPRSRSGSRTPGRSTPPTRPRTCSSPQPSPSPARRGCSRCCSELVREPLSTMNISDAALFRVIQAKRPTLFFDEVDAIFNKKAQERGDQGRAALAPERRLPTRRRVCRMGGGNHTTLESFEVFGAEGARRARHACRRRSRAVACESSSSAGGPTSRWRSSIPEDVAEEASALREWLGEVDGDRRSTRCARRGPAESRGSATARTRFGVRFWRSLSWPARCGRRGLDGRRSRSPDGDDDEASIGVLLLGDIRSVFEERQAERIATADLIRALADFDESPWGEWWLDRGRTSRPRAPPASSRSCSAPSASARTSRPHR